MLIVYACIRLSSTVKVGNVAYLAYFPAHGLIPENRSGADSSDLARDAAHQRGELQAKGFLVRVLYIQALMTMKGATSLMMTMKTISRTAKGLAICEAVWTLTESSLKPNRVEQVI
jgi:hypothetical protein